MTYAVFAIGFLARPLGAITFGQYADNYGRKKSMLLSMMIITITTTGIGLLPTYNQIGIFAPLMLIILRGIVNLFSESAKDSHRFSLGAKNLRSCIFPRI